MIPTIPKGARLWRPFSDQRRIRFRLSEADVIFDTVRQMLPHDSVNMVYPENEVSGYFQIASQRGFDKIVDKLRKFRRLREETE